MKYLKAIFIMTGLLLLTACVAPTNEAASEPINNAPIAKPPLTKTTVLHPPVQPGETINSADRATCEAAGGKVTQAGLIGWEHCAIPYPDADKVCSDSSECTGKCRYSLPPQGQGLVTGKCQADSLPFGCFAEVKNGKATPILCVD